MLLLPWTGCAMRTETTLSTSAIVSQPPATLTVTKTAKPTDSENILYFPSPTLGPTPTIVFDSGPEIPLPLLNDPLFFGQTPDCQLPCWNNLRAGSSNLSDIQRMFDEVFEFHGTINFLSDQAIRGQILVSEYPHTQTVGYSWTMNHGDYVVALELVIDESRNLQGIEIRNSLDSYSPYELIKVLGKPDAVWVSIASGTEETGQKFANIGLLMAYRTGLLFRYSAMSPLNNNTSQLGYCLNEKFPIGSIQIIGGFKDFVEENATPLQKEWLFKSLRRGSFQPIKDVLGITPEEFASIAMSQSPCFILPRPS